MGRHARNHANGQLWIVLDDRAHTDEHGVTGGAQYVGDPPLRVAADPFGVAGSGGDPSVDGLGELEDDIRTVGRGRHPTQQLAGVDRLVLASRIGDHARGATVPQAVLLRSKV